MTAVRFHKAEVVIDISTKFGVQIDFDVLKRQPSLNPQPEVDLQVCDRYLEKSI